MLSIATNKIVKRDNFIVLPMPTSVIAYLNKLASKDGRFQSKIQNVYNEIQYMHSVDKSTMPQFMPILPPNAEPLERAEILEPADIAMTQLVLADTPPEIGGVTTLSDENISELHPSGSDPSSPTDTHGAHRGTSQYNTDTSVSRVLSDSNEESAVSPTLPPIPSIETDNTGTLQSASDNVIEYCRNGSGTLRRQSEHSATFVTFNTPLVTTPTQKVSCTDSITAVLAKRKIESHI